MVYNKFSDYLKKRYGEKVYKLPVCIPVSCPNRDGTLASKGCIFCGEEGASFEGLPERMSVTEQLLKNAEYIGRTYNADKFIAYFQNFSNTYLPYESFRQYMWEAVASNPAAIYISTRPDCIPDRYLDFLSDLKRDKKIDIVLELGLQTVNYKTLSKLNRGHGLAEFIDAVLRIKDRCLEACAHYITDLPMDDLSDVKEGARILSALGVEQVKCHSLYVLEDTVLGNAYKAGLITPVTMEEFIERTISFLELLDPQIVVQRLLGRAPEERSLFCSWNTSWRKIQDMIEDRMKETGAYQGRLFNYLKGEAAMKRFE